MKTVAMNQSISSSNCKNKKSYRKNNHRIISRSSDQNISPSNMIYHGLLQSPPPSPSLSPAPAPRSLSFSYPPSRKQQQPPLLPLPFPKPINNRFSCPPAIGGNRSIDLKKKPVTGLDNPISIEPLGPDPKELPKNIDLEKFSGSAIFTLSPPPSSLPLPNFFRRSKLSCNMEVGGVNLGATDNLRRLLRLQ